MKNKSKKRKNGFKISKLISILIILSVILVTATTFQNFTKVEYYETDLTNNVGILAGNVFGQNFTIGTITTNQNYTLKGFSIDSYAGDGALPNISLYDTDVGGKPTNMLVNNNTCYINNVRKWNNCSMPTYTLQKSQVYAIVIVPNDTMYWYADQAGATYAGGIRLNDGLVPLSGSDFGFRVYGDEGLVVNLNKPADDFVSLNNNITFNCSSTLVGGVLNLTLIVNGINNETVTNSTGNQNLSLEKSIIFSEGDYNWTCKAYGYDDSITSPASRFFNITDFIDSTPLYNSSTYETSREQFKINITFDNSSYTDISAILSYNNTNYTVTESISGANATFTSNINIELLPSGNNVNNTFFWHLNLTNSTGSKLETTQSYLQQENQLVWGLCNSTITTKFLNITFKDETDSSVINATIPSSTWQYYLGDGTINKTYTFINNTNNSYYHFCTNVNKTFHIDPYVQYAGDGYPQRVWDIGETDYTNVTTNQVLYLLATADGIYVTFQVINSAEQAISGVIVNATREIGGEDVIVGQGTTGADGGITFWLNPDYQHTLTFYKSGYDLYQTTITPTNSEYTIQLTSDTSEDVDDYSQGITYTIKPSVTYLSNGTTYSFNMTLSSSYWEIDSFGFNLTNEDGDLLDSDSSASEGTLNINLNTGENSTIIMNYYWIIEGNMTTGSRDWLVIDLSQDSWSIKNLLDDFVRYIEDEDGIFGLTNFGVGLIMFFIIFIITGVFSYKYGVTNYATLVGVIFGLVALFDVGLGLIPNPVGAINYFPTFFIGIIAAALFLREVAT